MSQLDTTALKNILSSTTPERFCLSDVGLDDLLCKLIETQSNANITKVLNYNIDSLIYLTRIVKDKETLIQKIFHMVDVGILNVSHDFFDIKRRYLRTTSACYARLYGDKERQIYNVVCEFIFDLYAAIKVHDNAVMQSFLNSNNAIYKKMYVIGIVGETPLSILSKYRLTAAAKRSFVAEISGS